MLDTYIKNRGTTKTIVHNNNRNTINETNWDADYDGNVANVSLDLSKNGRNKHLDFKLTNDDLANMLSIPSVNQPIHKRLKIDFRKPESSFDKIFLELDPESSSDSDSSLENMDTLFDDNFNLDNFNIDDNSSSNVNPIQELLTHISSPKSNEEFIMPFQDYSLQDYKPVIKVVHKPRTSRKSSNKSRKFKHVDSNKLNNHKFNNHKLKHHNYPSTRKSSKRKSSKRKSSKRRKSRSTYFF